MGQDKSQIKMQVEMCSTISLRSSRSVLNIISEGIQNHYGIHKRTSGLPGGWEFRKTLKTAIFNEMLLLNPDRLEKSENHDFCRASVMDAPKIPNRGTYKSVTNKDSCNTSDLIN